MVSHTYTRARVPYKAFYALLFVAVILCEQRG